jgi:hypothetical protein
LEGAATGHRFRAAETLLGEEIPSSNNSAVASCESTQGTDQEAAAEEENVLSEVHQYGYEVQSAERL